MITFDLDCHGLAKTLWAGLSDPYHPRTDEQAIALLEGTLRDYTGQAFDAAKGGMRAIIQAARPHVVCCEQTLCDDLLRRLGGRQEE